MLEMVIEHDLNPRGFTHTNTELYTMACKTNIHSKYDDLNRELPDYRHNTFYKRVAMRMDITSDCDEHTEIEGKIE